MSLDSNLHVGPYMVVKGEKIEEEVTTCINIECIVHIRNTSKTGKYCDECGSPIGLKNVKKEEKLHARDFDQLDKCEEFVDELIYTDPICGKSNIFISNYTAPFDKKGRFMDEDGGDLDLRGINIESEIDWFIKKHEKVINFIKSIFGEDSVEIKWGIVQ